MGAMWCSLRMTNLMEDLSLVGLSTKDIRCSTGLYRVFGCPAWRNTWTFLSPPPKPTTREVWVNQYETEGQANIAASGMQMPARLGGRAHKITITEPS